MYSYSISRLGYWAKSDGVYQFLNQYLLKKEKKRKSKD